MPLFHKAFAGLGLAAVLGLAVAPTVARADGWRHERWEHGWRHEGWHGGWRRPAVVVAPRAYYAPPPPVYYAPPPVYYAPPPPVYVAPGVSLGIGIRIP